MPVLVGICCAVRTPSPKPVRCWSASCCFAFTFDGRSSEATPVPSACVSDLRAPFLIEGNTKARPWVRCEAYQQVRLQEKTFDDPSDVWHPPDCQQGMLSR